MAWTQGYDPLNNMLLLTLLADLSIIVLLDGIGIFHIRAALCHCGNGF